MNTSTIIIIAILLLGLAFWLRRRAQRANASITITNTKVLVCSVGTNESFENLMETDAAIYSKFYGQAEKNQVSTIHDLIELIKTSYYDIIHLLVQINADGTVDSLSGYTFLDACARAEVKLIFVASDNPADHINAAFATGQWPAYLKERFNLVLTLERRGDVFSEWLEKLLEKMSGGKSMPVAWVELHPQVVGQWSEKSPECTFYAGLGNVRFLP